MATNRYVQGSGSVEPLHNGGAMPRTGRAGGDGPRSRSRFVARYVVAVLGLIWGLAPAEILAAPLAEPRSPDTRSPDTRSMPGSIAPIPWGSEPFTPVPLALLALDHPALTGSSFRMSRLSSALVHWGLKSPALKNLSLPLAPSTPLVQAAPDSAPASPDSPEATGDNDPSGAGFTRYWRVITLGSIVLIFLIPVGAVLWANRPLGDFPDIDAKVPATQPPQRPDRPGLGAQSQQFGVLRLALLAPPLPWPSPLADRALTLDSTPETLRLPDPEALVLALLRLAPHWSHAKLTLETDLDSEVGAQRVQSVLLKDKASLGPESTLPVPESTLPKFPIDPGASYWVVTCVFCIQGQVWNWSQPYEAETLTMILEQMATLSPPHLQDLYGFVVPAGAADLTGGGAVGLTAEQLLVRYPDLVAL
ncbi:MAG: hypothetical protein ACO4CG_07845 [Prochlorothrix sp.]|nr:hypothetical protein [Prochlorothrix sp.]